MTQMSSESKYTCTAFLPFDRYQRSADFVGVLEMPEAGVWFLDKSP
jgi:hypothetical protein